MKRLGIILDYAGDAILGVGAGEHFAGHHGAVFTVLMVLGRVCTRVGRLLIELHAADYENLEKKKDRLPVAP